MKISSLYNNLLFGFVFNERHLSNIPYPRLIDYRLDGNALDSSEYSKHGSVNNATPSIDRHGNDNGCFYFGSSSTDPYILVDKTNIWMNRYHIWTFSAWVKLDELNSSGGTQHVFSLLQSNGEGWQIYYSSEYSGFTFHIQDGDGSVYRTITYTEYSTVDEWVHLFVNCGASANSNGFYLNGISGNTNIIENTCYGRIFYGTICKIGNNYDNTSPFLGYIDDVQIYYDSNELFGRKFLDSEAIKIFNDGLIYNRFKELKTGNLLYCYRFVQGENKYNEEKSSFTSDGIYETIIPNSSKLTQFTLFYRCYNVSKSPIVFNVDGFINNITTIGTEIRTLYNISGVTSSSRYLNIYKEEWQDIIIIGDINNSAAETLYVDGVVITRNTGTSAPPYYFEDDFYITIGINKLSHLYMWDYAMTENEMKLLLESKL